MIYFDVFINSNLNKNNFCLYYLNLKLDLYLNYYLNINYLKYNKLYIFY
jgi:hypothetical protein